MAGKVAKVPFPKFPMHEFNDATYLDKRPTGGWNMEENDVLDQLRDQRFQRRVEILEQLLITVRRNGGKLPFQNQQAIFRGLGLALTDSNWDVRLKCIQLINEVIPQFGDGLDGCMTEVMGKLIPNIGESKITVRRAVIQTLHVYMKVTNHVPSLLKAIVHYGLENENPRVRKESIIALPMLFTPEFAKENFYDITQSLAKKLLDTSVEDNLRDCSLTTLEKIRTLVGDREFNSYLHKLSPPLRSFYGQLTGQVEIDTGDQTNRGNYSMANGSGQQQSQAKNGPPFSKSNNTRMNGQPQQQQHYQQQHQQQQHQQHQQHQQSYQQQHYQQQQHHQMQSGRGHAQYVDSYEFGIIPSHVMAQISDQENFKLRAKGVEELRNIMYDLNEVDVQANLMPHMLSFISFLNNLLDDSNFKITTVTLEILCILVEKLGKNVKQYLKPLINTLTKRMGDNKIVVRQAVMKVTTKMMQSYSPKPVLSVICENLQHKNSKVRQETLNIIIAALLTFPSYAFDLSTVCRNVAPTLTDGKRQVRQGALECLAVIAQTMGPGRLQPLVHAVDQVELSQEGEGVMGAVQARLARRQLPKLNSEGLVEYATPVPSSASTRSSASFQTQGADMEWIMSGSSSSRNLSRSDTMELESVTSSTCPTPTAIGTEMNGRPYMSAGKGRKKLPWEGESSNGQNDGPPKPKKQPWSNSDEGNDMYNKKPIVKRHTGPVVPPQQQEESSPQEGSYKQIHLQKLKKTQSLTSKSSNFRSLDLAVSGEKDESKALPANTLLVPLPYKAEFDLDDYRFSSTDSPEDTRRGKDEESPIPLKATLARSATRRNTRKVPPISGSDKYGSNHDDDVDSAYPASLDSTLERESHYEKMESLKGIRSQEKMMNSLMSIRSSASKKKEKIIEQQSSSSSLISRSPSPDTLKESGIWSNSSNVESESSKKKFKKVDSPFESRPKIPRESPFESKPKLARTSSLSNNKKNIDNNAEEMVFVDYNPSSGVTFRENRNPDVQIVGKGYSDETSPTDTKSLNNINNKAKERRRVTKGSALSPLGVASMHSYGSLELEDEKVHTPSPEGIGVIGIGMFENVNGLEHAINAGNSQSNDRSDRKPMRQDRKDFTSGVVGVGMNKQGSYDDPGMDLLEDVEDPHNLRMSQKLSDTIALRKKQIEEEAEQKRVEREKKKQEHDEKVKKERERQQEKLRRLNTNESLDIESLSISGAGSGSGSSSSIHTPKTQSSPSITPRKKSKPHMDADSSHPLSASTRTPLDSENPSEWTPYKDPDAALRAAHKNMAQEDWELKCNGLNSVRRLSMFHRDTLLSNLHPVIVALLTEIKNLRSQVSRLAVVCIGELFKSLSKAMDTDLDMIVKGLLHKNGESNMFIREDSERALACMVDTVTPGRALVALIAGGATHKNIQVRKTTSNFLVIIVERMGPGKMLSGVKDITDRILPAIAAFSMDSSPETRYNARRMLHMMMTHQDFDKMLSKHLPTNTFRNVKEIVESLRVKGIGDGPNETSSARGWRSGHGSRSSSVVRGSSANSEHDHHPTPKRKNTRMDEATMEEIKVMNSQLAASDWKDRYNGITTLLETCEVNPNLVSNNIIKIFDKFLPRLQDPNSKVNLYALQVMLQIIPILTDALAAVINMAVGNVAPNLSSKNKEINTTAMDVINSLIENLDGALLIQPMANQAQSASARSKPHLVQKVAELAGKVYPKKQKQVILHVLPLLWHLLGATNSSGSFQGGSSDIRSATGTLANSLYQHMGHSLIERASSDANVTPRHIQVLQDLIDR